jgi:aryl-alcohol dehydrogenase (NADP+)
VIVDAVAGIADRRGVTRAQVALAWLRREPTVVAPIVGVTRAEHLDEAVASVSLELTDDEAAELEKPYTTRPVTGIDVRR